MYNTDEINTFKLTPKNKSFKNQLLKWVGNKQKQADDIISFFPSKFGTYFEPFLGSGGVLGTLAPKKAVASDIFQPLIEIWKMLHSDKDCLKDWYEARFNLIDLLSKEIAYKKILDSYNLNPNGADLLFILRTCYGGVVRFRKADGYMSTPCGPHNPMHPIKFNERVDIWHDRTKNVIFENYDFKEAMDLAKKGDLIYCDPPYSDSQSILYGAHAFSLNELFEKIRECKDKGVFIALSIDGTKFSGEKICNIDIPSRLFEREVQINVGRSMLKRFQMDGRTLEHHVVTDRLLLTY